MNKPTSLKFFLPIIFGFIIAGCAHAEVKTTKEAMDQKLTEITDLIDDAKCTENSHCSALAIGAKPCGGPWLYRIYSKQVSDTKQLKILAMDYKLLNKKYNKENQLMSDCMMATPPAFACINQKCQKVDQ